MNVVFLAPTSRRRRALAIETARAADEGHHVLLVTERGSAWQGGGLDPRVRVHVIATAHLRATERRTTRLFGRRLPLGLLRRIGRGPLRRPADRLARKWRSTVVRRLDKRLDARTRVLREHRKTERTAEECTGWNPDWIVLCEPVALRRCAGFLPPLLDERPDVRTSYMFETPLERSRS
ncbi:hypothetical protein [Glycomyces arizonensis]|uniref:hypothetical protein n=1 Tax=Glycomyces arizonensis TaxID=256035 RepID=UPI000427B9FD|nr:hypothetical protein [Glycomyces arizonensis]